MKLYSTYLGMEKPFLILPHARWHFIAIGARAMDHVQVCLAGATVLRAWGIVNQGSPSCLGIRYRSLLHWEACVVK